MPDLFVSDQASLQDKTSASGTSQPILQHGEFNQTQIPSTGKLGFFSTFITNPEGVQFEHQEIDETVLLLMRKHHITNTKWIIITIFLSILPLIIQLIQVSLGVSFFDFSASYMIILTVFYYLLVFGYAFVSFITWFYNVGILTKKRLVDIDFSDIMYKNVATTRLSDIVDVEYTQGGFLHSLFDYGDVLVQTEGIKPNFEFHAVPKPSIVVNMILTHIGKKEKKHV